MKILWITNTIFPELANEMNMTFSNSGGWMHQFKDSLSRENDLVICSFDINHKKLIERKVGNIKFYIIPKNITLPTKYDKSIETYLSHIFIVENPDIIHVWGTEFPHTFSAIKVADKLNIQNIISIQGMIYDYTRHYNNFISILSQMKFTFRDFIRFDNLYLQQKKFKKRGTFEKQTLLLANNVIGRTSYDNACCYEINPKLNYFFCNECLRNSFYSDSWDLNKIERRSIFISQASYPIKGFHVFLDALQILKRFDSEIKVYVGGGFSPFTNTFSEKIRESSYGRYIRKKIISLNLIDNINFVGNLSELEMKKHMLKSHVFVSPSLIENSPNSVGEAMLLGVPVVSSYVGGVRDMIEDNISGMLYPVDQPNILAHHIIKIFKDDNFALKLSKNERTKALKIFDIEKNTNQLKKIYNNVAFSVEGKEKHD